MLNHLLTGLHNESIIFGIDWYFILFFIIVGSWGGLVREMHLFLDSGEKTSFYEKIQRAFIGGFAGFILGLFAKFTLGTASHIIWIIFAGMSGYLGTKLLDLVAGKIEKKIGEIDLGNGAANTGATQSYSEIPPNPLPMEHTVAPVVTVYPAENHEILPNPIPHPLNKWASQRDPVYGEYALGTSGLKFKDAGCYATSVLNFYGKDPAVIYPFIKDTAWNSQGMLNDTILSNACGGKPGERSATDKGGKCVLKVHGVGFPFHFVLRLDDLSIVDPWDMIPQPKVNKYTVLEYRYFL